MEDCRVYANEKMYTGPPAPGARVCPARTHVPGEAPRQRFLTLCSRMPFVLRAAPATRLRTGAKFTPRCTPVLYTSTRPECPPIRRTAAPRRRHFSPRAALLVDFASGRPAPISAPASLSLCLRSSFPRRGRVIRRGRRAGGGHAADFDATDRAEMKAEIGSR